MSDPLLDLDLESCVEDESSVVLRKDERGVKLYDSTHDLPQLLQLLLLIHPRQDMDALYARFWRDALVIVLRHLKRAGHEQLARILAAELLVIASTVTSSINPITGVHTPPNVATARSMARDLKRLLHRSYSRGSLKPIDSQAPALLRLWCRKAEKALDPLTRPGAETLWRKLSDKRFPADLWDNLNTAKGARFRAKVFVAALNGCSSDSLNRTLQRSSQRSLR